MPDRHDPLAGAFTAFHGAAAPHVVPPGAAGLRERLRTRRRRLKAISTAGLVLAVTGAVAGVLRAGGGAADPDTGTQTAQGGITLEQLGRSVLDVPAWRHAGALGPCTSGPTQFTQGRHDGPTITLKVQQAVDVDLDRDGAADTTVVHLSCQNSFIVSFQVIAVRRGGTGALRTVGQVAARDGDLEGVCALRAGPEATVDIQVVSGEAGCSNPPSAPGTTQWRTYTWDGQRFAQTGGPATFPAQPGSADLSIRVGTLILGPPSGGLRRGTLTVTVRNNGTVHLPGWWVYLPIPATAMVGSPDGCSYLSPADTTAAACTGPPTGPGEERSVMIDVAVMEDPPWQFTTPQQAQVRPPDEYADPDSANNYAEYTVTQ
jgi:hypothetical protein